MHIGGGNSLKSAIFANFGPPWPWPWPWIGTHHTAYRRVSIINLYLQTKVRSNRKNFM